VETLALLPIQGTMAKNVWQKDKKSGLFFDVHLFAIDAFGPRCLEASQENARRQKNRGQKIGK
jgi:hypothetical protein